MTTLAATMPTLADAAKATGADGKILRTAEVLTKLSPVMGDMPWQVGNLTLGHRVSVRTSLPTPTARRFNQRVLPTKSTRAQNDEQCAQLVDYADVDCSIADLNGNAAQFRMNEGYAHMQGMGIEFERQVFYGNSAAVQEEFDGFLPRMTAASDTVIDAGGAGSDNSSILLVGWGLQTVYGIVPKGLNQGIKHEDKGRVTSETSSGLMDVYRDRWELNCGIAVENPNYLAAIRAIDVSVVVGDPTGATTNLIKLMIQLAHSVENIESPLIKPILYMNRSLFSAFDVQNVFKSNAYFNVGMEEGKLRASFRGIPIHVSDALTETESTI